MAPSWKDNVTVKTVQGPDRRRGQLPLADNGHRPYLGQRHINILP